MGLEIIQSSVIADSSVFPGYRGLEDYQIQEQNFRYKVGQRFTIDSFGHLFGCDESIILTFTNEQNLIFSLLLSFTPSEVSSNTLHHVLNPHSGFVNSKESNLIATLIYSTRKKLKGIDGIDINTYRGWNSYSLEITDCNK